MLAYLFCCNHMLARGSSSCIISFFHLTKGEGKKNSRF
jgi:hypothetical protein